MRYPKVVKHLIKLIEKDKRIGTELDKSIKDADIRGISDLNSFLEFLSETLFCYPATSKILDTRSKIYYYIISRSEYLENNKTFKRWMHRYTSMYGKFLDSPKSTVYLKNFYDDPRFKIEEYYEPASGWMSFNQFFTRRPKPGKRIIDDMSNNDIIVSPVDGTFTDYGKIKDSHIIAKGIKFSVYNLITKSDFADFFVDGTFFTMHLELYNYHWFHVPVGGKIVEIKNIPGDLYLDVTKDANGHLVASNSGKLHIRQNRGLLVLDTNKNGYVAIVPLGLDHVASVNLLPNKNDYLFKGQEFGFFAYGGSDIVVLFSNPNISIIAQNDTSYSQGNKIGYFIN